MRISDWSSDVCSSDLRCISASNWRNSSLAQSPLLASSNKRPTSASSVSDGFGQLRTLVMPVNRSEEHTSELQSLMRISFAVFCLQKNKDRRDATGSTAHSMTAITKQ